MISYKKTQLADLLGLKTQGALVRSRFLSIEQMDAPSKYFFSLEKKNGQKHFLHALRSEAVILSSHAEIRKRAYGFYENLYKNELGLGWDSESVFFFFKFDSSVRGGQCRALGCFKHGGVAQGPSRHGFWESARN